MSLIYHQISSNAHLICLFCANKRFGGCGSILSIHTDELPDLGVKLECVGGVMADRAVSILKDFYKGENTNCPEEKRKVKQTENE